MVDWNDNIIETRGGAGPQLDDPWADENKEWQGGKGFNELLQEQEAAALNESQKAEQDYLDELAQLNAEQAEVKGEWYRDKYIIPNVGSWEHINRTGNAEIDWAFMPAGKYDANVWAQKYLDRDINAKFETPAMPKAVTDVAEMFNRNVGTAMEYYQTITSQKSRTDWDAADDFAYNATFVGNTDVIPLMGGASGAMGTERFRQWMMVGDRGRYNQDGTPKDNWVLIKGVPPLDKEGNPNYAFTTIMKNNPELAYFVNSAIRQGFNTTVGLDRMGMPFYTINGQTFPTNQYQNDLASFANTINDKLFGRNFYGRQLLKYDPENKTDVSRLSELRSQLEVMLNNQNLSESIRNELVNFQGMLNKFSTGELKLNKDDLKTLTSTIWDEYYAASSDKDKKYGFDGTYVLDIGTGKWVNQSGYKAVKDLETGKTSYVRGVTNIDIAANDQRTLVYQQTIENNQYFGVPYSDIELQTVFGADILKTKEIFKQREQYLKPLYEQMQDPKNNWTSVNYNNQGNVIVPIQVPGMDVKGVYQKYWMFVPDEKLNEIPAVYFQHNVPLAVWLSDNRVVQATDEEEFKELLAYIAEKGIENKPTSGIKLMSVQQLYADELLANKITLLPAVPETWTGKNDASGRYIGLQMPNGWTRTIEGYEDKDGNKYTINDIKRSLELMNKLSSSFTDSDIAELREWANGNTKAFVDLVKDTHYLPETKVLFDRVFEDYNETDRNNLRLFVGLDKDDKIKYVNDLLKTGDTPLTRELLKDILPERDNPFSAIGKGLASGIFPAVGLLTSYEAYKNVNPIDAAFAPEAVKQMYGGIGDVYSNAANIAKWFGAEGIGNKILTETALGRNLVMPADMTTWESMSVADKAATVGLVASRQLPMLAVTTAIAVVSGAFSGAVIPAVIGGTAAKVTPIVSNIIGVITGVTSDYLTQGVLNGVMEGGQTYESYLQLHPGDINGARKTAGATFWDNMALQGTNIPEFLLNIGIGKKIGVSKLYNTVRKGTAFAVSGLTEGGEEVFQNWIQAKNLEQPFQMESPENQVTFLTAFVMGMGMSGGVQWANGHFNNIVNNTVEKLPDELQWEYQNQYETALAQGLDEQQARIQAINEMAEIPTVQEILTDNAVAENDVIVNEQVEASIKRAEAVKQQITTYQGDTVQIGEMVNYGAFNDRGLLVGGTSDEAMVRPIQTKNGVLIGFKEPVNVKNTVRKISEPVPLSEEESIIVENQKKTLINTKQVETVSEQATTPEKTTTGTNEATTQPTVNTETPVTTNEQPENVQNDVQPMAAENQPTLNNEESNLAGNIRLEKYPEEVRDIIKKVADDNPDVIQEARRGIISDEQVMAEAQQLVNETGGKFEDLQKNWKSGQAWNAEEITALRLALRNKSQEIFNIAQQIKESPTNAELKANLTLAIEEQAALQKSLYGVTAEAGRSLRSFRQVLFDARTASDADKLTEIFKRIGNEKQINDIADKIALLDLNDPYVVNSFFRDVTKPKFIDYVTELFYNSILSGPKTHIVNFGSNTLNVVMSPFERATSAAVESVSSPLQGRSKQRYFGEVQQSIFGIIRGIPEGARAALDIITKGGTIEEANKWEMKKEAFTGTAGKIINFPSRMLEAADMFGKAINRMESLRAEAFRIASNEKLTGEAFTNRLNELINNPTEDLLRRANLNAEYRLFRQEPGSLTKAIIKLRDAEIAGIQPLRFVIPFIRTPANLVKYGMERSPLGVFNYKMWQNAINKNPEASDQIARWVIGSVIASALAVYAADDKLTGSAPDGTAEKDKFYREGKQPFSVKIGDTWVSYQRLEPFNQLLSQVAAFASAVKNNKDVGNIVGEIYSTISANLVSQTYLNGLNNLISGIEDPQYRGVYLLQQIASGFVPYSSLLRTITQATDTTIRQPKGIVENIQTGIPGLSKDITARINVFGEPSIRETPFFSPINITKDKADKFNQILDKSGISIGFVSNTLNGKKLTDEQYYDFKVLAGQITKQYLINSIEKGKTSLNDLEKAVTAARKEARSQYEKTLNKK